MPRDLLGEAPGSPLQGEEPEVAEGRSDEKKGGSPQTLTSMEYALLPRPTAESRMGQRGRKGKSRRKSRNDNSTAAPVNAALKSVCISEGRLADSHRPPTSLFERASLPLGSPTIRPDYRPESRPENNIPSP